MILSMNDPVGWVGWFALVYSIAITILCLLILREWGKTIESWRKTIRWSKETNKELWDQIHELERKVRP